MKCKVINWLSVIREIENTFFLQIVVHAVIIVTEIVYIIVIVIVVFIKYKYEK